MPVVSRISIAPVKGLGLLHPDEVTLEKTGVAANRRFHIVDSDGRRYNQLRNGQLVQIKPAYDSESGRLTLRFPDGAVAGGTVALGEEITTDFYGRPVAGNLVVGPWSDALSTWAGRTLRLVQSAPGAAVDRRRGNVSLVSTASLAELARRGGQSEPVDGRRFRMLFQLDDCEPHEEDGWVKRHLRIGEAVVYVRNDVGRCAITTQNPETGVPDFDTLRTISSYRDLSPPLLDPFATESRREEGVDTFFARQVLAVRREAKCGRFALGEASTKEVPPCGYGSPRSRAGTRRSSTSSWMSACRRAT